jgi:hypothetical protein
MISYSQNGDRIKIYFEGKVLAVVSQECLMSFLGGIQPHIIKFMFGFMKKVDVKKKKKKEENPVKLRAESFMNFYAEQYKENMKGRRCPTFKKNDGNYHHFLKAAKIIAKHECTFDDFLKAQIEGLKFTKTFPKPGNLSTPQAETRLHDYLQQKERTWLTNEEIEKPLLKNERYVDFLERIKLGVAEAYQAIYVANCQYDRRGTVQEVVKKYLKKLGVHHEGAD